MVIGFSLVCLAFGAALVASAVGQWRAEQRRRGWPTVRGRLLERGQVELDVNGWRLRPRYEYIVGAERLENDQWRSQATSRLSHWGNARPKLAAISDEPLVHFNPSHPSDSFLEQTPLTATVLVFVFGTCLGGLGVVLLAKLVG